MKKILIACVTLILLMGVAGCGKNTSTSGEASKNDKEIKVITTAGGYPFNATNPKTNKIEGFIIDIVNEVAKRSGVKTQISTGEWNSLIPSLQSGKADVIADAMYITDERKKQINFTNPVFSFGEGLIVPERDKTTKSLKDLKGKVIGVQMGTSFKDMLEKENKDLNIKVKTYQTLSDLLKDIQTNRIDAALADAPTFSYFKAKNPNMKYRIVEGYVPSLTGEVGIGVSKDRSELVKKFNKAIQEMKADGTLKDIYKKWGVDWDFN
ncbi:ABC transporter substrate-binding protein [Priestia aryabhattai]|uniref:substrate-binding periplasmic protein n=1 Tax=Priestia aryabhattai TaxID=412384 RepID=UPI002452B16A|nr:ABC transporter substrate-binding protein [Priestia aryabhattai]MDH3113362.1 ABC transporter substrate-binding protein [Priestia aryabhattai]MDH3127732.1 ABC transporter substrate-binding protein [Priestia aryabhattai]MED4152542.1 ABC transporter substrate-binding protein [Priestia aryabhattai]